MMAVNKFMWTLIILLSIIYKTTGIRCYYCNSHNNSACLDLTKYNDEERARIVPVVNCETSVPSPVAISFFCRKIVQTINVDPHRDSEVRVTRGCGWVPHSKPCYTANNMDHQEQVCQCSTDYCNAADSPEPATAVVWFTVLAGCLYFYR